MGIKFSRISCFAVGALLAGSAAFAQTETVKPMSKIEAKAACDTLVERIAEARKNGTLESVRRDVELCDQIVKSIFEELRQSGSEYFIAGLGVFVGAEGNSPAFYRVSGGARIAVGGSAFVTNEVGLRFTPLVNLGVAAQGGLKGSAQIFEPQVGFIVYKGSTTTKSIEQFNGIYAGGNFETPNPLASALNGRSSLTVSMLKSMSSNAYALVVMRSFTAGTDSVAAGVNAMSVNNVTSNGAGAKFSDIFSGVGSQFRALVDNGSKELSRVFGRN